MEIIRSVTSPYQRYDWDEWLDGQARRAKHLEDFTVTPKDFGIQVRRAAKARGLKVNVAVNSKNGTVDFQAVLPAQKGPGRRDEPAARIPDVPIRLEGSAA